MIRLFIFLTSVVVWNTEIAEAQVLTESQLKFLEANAVNVQLDSAYSNGYWSAISPHVKRKRIVLLGEFSHGAKEVFTSRNDLIQYLHRSLGFNVIFFEAGIGEMAYSELHKEKLTAVQMTHGFFGVWQTDEFVDLMNYVQSNNISIAGFDVQRSGGGGFNYLLSDEANISGVDSMLYMDLERRFGNLKNQLANRKAVFDSVYVATNELIEDYQLVAEQLSKSRIAEPDQEFMLLQHTLTNRITFLTYMLEFVRNKDWNKRWAARDLAMADSIHWLLEDIYPDKKVIVIGHNYHIARTNAAEKVMGEYLGKLFAAEMYSIGFFAGGGTYAGNYRDDKIMFSPDSAGLDIKHIINGLDGRAHFIDMPESGNKGSNWLFEEITVNDSFIDLSGSNRLILKDQFDGIILLNEASMPDKDMFSKN